MDVSEVDVGPGREREREREGEREREREGRFFSFRLGRERGCPTRLWDR